METAGYVAHGQQPSRHKVETLDEVREIACSSTGRVFRGQVSLYETRRAIKNAYFVWCFGVDATQLWRVSNARGEFPLGEILRSGAIERRSAVG